MSCTKQDCLYSSLWQQTLFPNSGPIQEYSGLYSFIKLNFIVITLLITKQKKAYPPPLKPPTKGHLGGSVITCLPSAHDPRVLGWNPELGSLPGGEPAAPSACARSLTNV